MYILSLTMALGSADEGIFQSSLEPPLSCHLAGTEARSEEALKDDNSSSLGSRIISSLANQTSLL
jgi:hypothetical protein